MAIGRPVVNRHKVPKKTWTRWRPEAQRHFNDMMDELRGSMQGVLHPGDLLSKEAWRVLQWNVAWTAAHRLSRRLRERKTAS